MNICIVDDEQSCIDDLQSLLSQYGQETDTSISFHTFRDNASFISAFKPDLYDIIFLDIYIGDATGMDLAKHIRTFSESCIIIFCTTSVSDMPSAFRYHAFEYIVKPPEYDRICQIMNDAIEILPNLESYLNLPSAENGAIAVSSICSVTTSGHYLDITLNDQTVCRERMSLNGFMELLNKDSRFLLINKGILVNMDYIYTIKDKDCIMTNNTFFPVKVRESASIRKYWQEYNIDKIRKGQNR